MLDEACFYCSLHVMPCFKIVLVFPLSGHSSSAYMCECPPRRSSAAPKRCTWPALCGPVARLRLLGDATHNTRIAFVEFAAAEGAKAALNCSGALLGA